MNDWLKNNILKKGIKNLQKKVVTEKNNGQILKIILNNLTSTKNEEANLWKKCFRKIWQAEMFVKLDKLRVKYKQKKYGKMKMHVFLSKIIRICFWRRTKYSLKEKENREFFQKILSENLNSFLIIKFILGLGNVYL